MTRVWESGMEYDAGERVSRAHRIIAKAAAHERFNALPAEVRGEIVEKALTIERPQRRLRDVIVDRFTVRLGPYEGQSLRDVAALNGVSMSDMIRHALRVAKIIPEDAEEGV